MVSLSSRRPTDPNTLAALAAAEQRRQQLHSTREDRQARAWERTRVQHSAQHSRATVWQCHSAGTGSSSPARGGGFEQPYGAQVICSCTGHTASDTGMAKARAGGCRGGAAPPELPTHFNAAIHYRLQRPEWLRNGCTGAVLKECTPESLSLHYISMQVAAQAPPHFL